ncbi:hypothetical protein ILUMI_10227 [Ignelater luminosus]|uniref:HTH psq-type domain-containing protein n=1 Tax=Ignelater luminosus TaxID=2038154 RepID=A0A8K0GDT9_IGNLU|nr:hypothetical protein ILUMI_10227 [Ignelater luminosus]
MTAYFIYQRFRNLVKYDAVVDNLQQTKSLPTVPCSATGKERDKVDAAAVENAAKEVVAGRMTKREAFIHFKVSSITLARHLKKNSDPVEFPYQASNAVTKVFTDRQEKDLLNYVILASQWCFGVNVGETRKLAY